MQQFSFYRAPVANCTPCRQITINDLYKYLTWDGCKARTNDFRALPEDARKREKSKIFDYITPGGVFTKRTLDGLQSVSGYVILDFDHLDPDGVGLFCAFYVPAVLSFVSPSAKGVKVIIDYTNIFDLFGLFDLDFSQSANREYAARIYSEYWAISARIIDDQSCGKYQADRSGRDITRACFLCYDENAYLWERSQMINQI